MPIPAGMKLRAQLADHDAPIAALAWSTKGTHFATLTKAGLLEAYDWKLGTIVAQESPGSGCGLAWTADQRVFVATEKRPAIWSPLGPPDSFRWLDSGLEESLSVALSPDEQLVAIGGRSGLLELWRADGEPEIAGFLGLRGDAWVNAIAWHPEGDELALASSDGMLHLLDCKRRAGGKVSLEVDASLRGHASSILSTAWSSTGCLASAGFDHQILIWDPLRRSAIQSLSGHSGAVLKLSFSADGRLLASKSTDGSVRLWRCDTWETVAVLEETAAKDNTDAELAFHPRSPRLATLADGERGVRVWDLDVDLLLKRTGPVRTVHYTSAKVVLVGESEVGKTCLAQRLAEDRYDQDTKSTHGMRFWRVPIEADRDLVLWDLGGQPEYRLIHQLFLNDTTVALVLFHPERGEKAFADVEEWNRRLDGQLRRENRKVVKLLVATKQDEPNPTIDDKAVARLMMKGGFKAYVETSARTGKGVGELKQRILEAVDWASVIKTSRPELFQRIHDHVESEWQEGRVVQEYDEFVAHIRKSFQPQELTDPRPIESVVLLLAGQGRLVDVRLASGERWLVFRIDQVEAYAGSLILAAKSNPRGVPALETDLLALRKAGFPGMPEGGRSPKVYESILLQCVVQLLIERGLCFRQQNLLVFPALFAPAQDPIGPRAESVSVFYDFAGAVENIYSSLVARLAMSQGFGLVRLWRDQAEFEKAGAGLCGLHKEVKPDGTAHLDVYFSPDLPRERRDLFTAFIEMHLAEEGIDVREGLYVTCACGFTFSDETIKKRLADGKDFVTCPNDDTPNPILGGQDPDSKSRAIALKTKVHAETQVAVEQVKRAVARKTTAMAAANDAIHVLHLSDLHVGEKADVPSLLEPLLQDLRDKEDGLGIERLDYVVVSGDLTNRASPAEFERAFEFVAALLQKFGLSPDACAVVPGNHDQAWDPTPYDFRPRRSVEERRLAPGSYLLQPHGYLVREETRYRERFANFSKHFFHPLFQREYPLDPDHQCLALPTREEHGLQLLLLNSSWLVDEYFPERSGIRNEALSRGIMGADDQRRAAKLLRIAVWHHPVTGAETMKDVEFLERLQKAGVRLCLHGHVHEDKSELLFHLHPARRMYVVGCGSYNAPASDRPPSTPQLYNLMSIATDHSSVRVHTRSRRQAGGAFSGWAIWPAPDGAKLSYYDLPLD